MRPGRLAAVAGLGALLLQQVPAAAKAPPRLDVSGGVARAVRAAARGFPLEWIGFAFDYAECRSRFENNEVTVYRGEDELAVVFTSNGRCEGGGAARLGGPMLALVNAEDFGVRWVHDAAARDLQLKRFNASAARPDAGSARCASDAACAGGKCVRVSSGRDVFDLCVPLDP